MLLNYLKIAWRNLTRNKGFTFLNLSGLVIGMAGAMFILLWIQRELSVDRFHENGENIYEVYNRDNVDGEIWCWNSTPKVMGPVIRDEFPEIVDMTRVENAELIFSYGDRKIKRYGTFVDSTALEMFSFPLLVGDKTKVLDDPNGLVLTKKMAENLFGDEDPVGKTVRLENRIDLKVTGLLEDRPNNTDLYFLMIMPYSVSKQLGWHDDHWGNNSITTYVQLHPETNITEFQKKIKDVRQRHSSNESTKVFLHPFEDSYLYSRFENGKVAGGKIEAVRMFGVIAGIILLIACINFMNLSTARSERRSKEVGIRKISGARKGMLVGQFITESVVLSLISGLVALAIVQILLPFFNDIINVELTVPFTSLKFWLAFLSFVFITGLLAGSYPAFFLSSFQPVKVLKGTFIGAKSMLTPRKLLVVIQFTAAIVLIASTIIVYQQIEHTQNREKNYDQSRLIYSSLNEEIDNGFEAFRQEVMQKGLAEAVTKTMSPVTQSWSNSWGISWEGKDEDDKRLIYRFAADVEPVRTFGFKLIEGRDINVYKYATDSSVAILNEEAVKVMGFEDPIGQVVNDGDDAFTVVGVVKNFLNGSPFNNDKPMVIFGPNSWVASFHIKLTENMKTSENLEELEGVFDTHYPSIPFQYEFIDEDFAQTFQNQERIGKLTTIFSILAIIISCLGLFGLSAFAAEKRSKEIGVRKVLGASIASIVSLLSVDFVKLVIFSLLIGTPLAWFIMSEWLSGFDYRVSISALVFISTGLLAIIISLATVSFQAIKTASINPVNALKDE